MFDWNENKKSLIDEVKDLIARVENADEKGSWITVKGTHVFIPDGRDEKDVIAETFGKKGESKEPRVKRDEKKIKDYKTQMLKKYKEAETPEAKKAYLDYVNKEVEKWDKDVNYKEAADWLKEYDDSEVFGKEYDPSETKGETYLKKGDLEIDKVYKLGKIYVKPFIDKDGDLSFYDRTGAWGEGSLPQKFLKSDLANIKRVKQYDKLTDKELKFLSEKSENSLEDTFCEALAEVITEE